MSDRTGLFSTLFAKRIKRQGTTTGASGGGAACWRSIKHKHLRVWIGRFLLFAPDVVFESVIVVAAGHFSLGPDQNRGLDPFIVSDLYRRDRVSCGFRPLEVRHDSYP